MRNFFKSTFVYWIYAAILLVSFFVVKNVNENEIIRIPLESEYVDEIQKELCFNPKCTAEENKEFVNLAEFSKEEIESCSRLRSLLSINSQANGELFLSWEYKDKADVRIKGQNVRLEIKGGESRYVSDINIDRELMKKSSKIILYIWNPGKITYTIKGSNVKLQKALGEKEIKNKAVSVKSEVVFKLTSELKYIDVLSIKREELLKDHLKYVRIDLYTYIGQDGAEGEAIVEIRDAEDKIVSGYGIGLFSGLVKNSVTIDFSKELKKGEVLKVYLMSSGVFNKESFDRYNLRFYQ